MSDRYASLKQGLVGCWIPSVSGSGLLLPDLSGRGNNGSLVNMDASDWVSASYGRALDFDGVNDYVDTGTQLSFLDGNSEFTMCFWGQRRSSGAALTVGKRSGGNYILIAPWIDGNVYFELTNYFPAVASNLTSWAHYAMTLRGATIRGYINGSQVVSAAGPSTVPSVSANYVMGLEAGVPRYSDGGIDDFRIYNRALSEPEIKLLASEPGIGFKRISSSAFATRYAYKPAKPRNYSVIRNRDPNYSTLRQGLVAAYCPSISGQGNVLPDLVGGNHGTLTNMDASDWVSSGDGRALDFDGINDYVNLPSINLTNLFTVSFWYYARTITTNDGLVHEATSTAGIRFNSGIQYYSSNLSVLRIPTAPVGIWTHVAFTRDASGNVIGYLNGINSASGSGTGFVVDGLAYDYLISESRVLDGLLDDVRFYNRALSEPEIKLLSSKRGIGLEPRKPKITFADLGVQKTYSVVRVKETDYATLRQGLVGAWCPSLPNGGSGNTLPDQSGYNNHGSLVGMGPDDWVSASYGRALDFDGVNDFTTIPMNPIFNMPNVKTISAWIYARAYDGSFQVNDIVNTDNIDTTNRTWQFNAYDVNNNDTDAALNIYSFGTGGGDRNISTTNEVLTVNRWHHIAMTTIDGLVTVSSVFLFVDGISQATTDNSTGSYIGPNQLTTNNRLNFGRRPGNSGIDLHFNGQLDDIRIYNRALTESEIRLLASRPGIGLRQDRDRNTFYQFPSFQPALARRSSAIIGGGIT